MFTKPHPGTLGLYWIDVDTHEPIDAATGSDIIELGFVDRQSYDNLREANNEVCGERDDARAEREYLRMQTKALQTEVREGQSLLAQCSTRRSRECGRIRSLQAAVRKVAKERDEAKRELKTRHEEMSHATGIRYEADYISAPGPWDAIAKEAYDNRLAALEMYEWRGRAERAESAPLHPAVMRVIEAAKDIVSRGWSGASAEELRGSVRAIPSPLPRVVTCAECAQWCDDNGVCARHHGVWPTTGHCHLGVAR